MNKNLYKASIDNIHFSEDLNEKIISCLSSHTSQTEMQIPKMKVKNKKFYIAFSCINCTLALMLCIYLLHSKSDFKLPNAVGKVSVKYINKPPSISTNSSMMYMTEQELFHKFNTDIFMGKIEEVRNIEINLNGEAIYNAIAKIKVDKTYRGEEKAGETVTVLLPCPIDTNISVEDTAVVASMKEGMNGIFMLSKYDNTSCLEANGAKIYCQDIANYYFNDGMRYAFLQGEHGLIFEKSSYKSIASASTLEQIEQYVIKMIK